MTIQAPETIKTKDHRVACDGGEGALGHPRVYLTLDKDGKIDCPYCDRQYILIGGAADHS